MLVHGCAAAAPRTIKVAAPDLLLDLRFLPSPHGKIGLGLGLGDVWTTALQIGFQLGGREARLRCDVEDLSTCVCPSGQPWKGGGEDSAP